MNIKKIGIAVFILASISTATAQEVTPAPDANEAAELAKKLANPIASLISVPFQNNTDYGIGDLNGTRNVLNVQPVVPITLNENITLITRAIFPVVSQYNITGEGSTQSGLGDAVISGFISPANSSFTWGVGPVFLVPTGTDQLLSTEKFGLGPTAVALKQFNGWTIGGLVNQIWSVAGEEDRADVSQLFVQPFINYNWKSGAGLGVNTEITQDWNSERTTAYVSGLITGVTSMGSQKVQLGFGPRIQYSGATTAQFGWRALVIFLFPK